MVKINETFRALVPPLSDSEYAELEQSILSEGCRDPLIVWKDTIVDGHNRYEICVKHNLPFRTLEMNFDSEEDAKVWIITNQLARRNITDFTRIELALMRKDILLAKGKEKMQSAGKDGSDMRWGLLQNNKPQEDPEIEGLTNWSNPIVEPHNTRQIMAKELRVGQGTIERAEVILKQAPEELKDQLRCGDISINKAYTEIKRKDAIEKLNSIDEKQAKEIDGVYDVIVIDPPWEMKKIERDVAPNQVEFDYPTMSLQELRTLQIPCADDCHVWLWTTHKYLPFAFELLREWGLNYVCTFVWHKAGGFQPFDLPQYNCEFALYARRGTPIFTELKDFKVCFDAPRAGHSEKPEQFYDMVRRVTGGRRLDMFNRRKIDGFETWGNEAK